MTMKKAVEEFLAGEKLAVVGVSRSGKRFGNTILKDLRKKGYRVYAINRSAAVIDGEQSYADLKSLPEVVDGIVVVVPPQQTEQVVKQAHHVGIKRIWLQQGAESDEAIRFCEEKGMDVIHGHCILMFAEPVNGFHGFHRWIWNMFGKSPK